MHVQLEGVRISQDGAAEMDGSRRIIFVPRDDILRIELRHGSAAERPLVALLLGVALFALGCAAVVLAGVSLRNGHPLALRYLTVGLFALPGWWLLDLALRRRWYVFIHERRGSRKVVFHRTRDGRAIEAFVSEAKSRFGYA